LYIKAKSRLTLTKK